MKKTLTLFTFLFAAIVNAFAADGSEKVAVCDTASYVGDLDITVGGKTTTNKNTVIFIKRSDGDPCLYALSIKDFSFSGMNLGDINLNDVAGEVGADGNLRLTTTKQDVSVKLGLVPVTVSVTLDGVVSGTNFKTNELVISKVPAVNSVSVAYDGESTVRLVNPATPKPPVAAVKQVTLLREGDQIFTITGHQVPAMTRGVYIVRHADGTASKVVKR